MTEKLAVVLARDRKPTPEREALQRQLLAGLQGRAELDVAVTAHLYDLPPDGPGVEWLRSVAGDLVVLAWLYPRSAYWVLDANGVRGRLGRTSSLQEGDADEPPQRGKSAAPDRTLWCLDLRDHDTADPYLAEIERIAEAKLSVLPQAASPGGSARVLDEPARARWYPVLDRDRCEECHECLNFCLFGVYGLDENGSVRIEQPDACRPGCPACARICPKGAIMFPQHSDPGIAGDPSVLPGGLKLDLSQLFAGASPAELAELERQRALMKQKGDGPGPLDRLVDGLEGLDL